MKFEPDDMVAPETAQPRFSYIVIARFLAALQMVALMGGMLTVAYMETVDDTVSRGANMDHAQITMYGLIAAAAFALLAFELDLWERRVQSVLGDVAKHKDEAPIPHDADPIPDESTPFGFVSRVVRICSFACTSLLAGASLPGASMMLAGETPSGHTLHAAWVMWLCALAALAMAMLRHMAPFLSKRMTVFREDCEGEPGRGLVPPLAVLAVCDAAVFGAAVVAAFRPMSSITLTPVRRSMLTVQPSHTTWLDDTMLKHVVAYGDIERDAMTVIAFISGCACLTWLAVAYLVSSSERLARLRVVVVSLGVLGSALQGQLAGTVMPIMGVTNSTARYAGNLAAGAPGTRAVWMQDPLSSVITTFIVLAGAVNIVAFVVSRV